MSILLPLAQVVVGSSPLISVVITLIVVGVALYLMEMLPLDGAIKTVIRVLVILAAVLWVLSLLTGYRTL